jgi:Protein of unknown function (DUF3159)
MMTGSDDRTPGVEDALASAARRAGFDRAGGPVTARGVLATIGGVRGVIESLLPTLVFVVLFVLTNLPVALGVSVGVAAVFVLLRALQRSPVAPAVGGLLAAIASAVLSLITGRPEDNFVLGLIQNAAYGGVLLISVLVGWPLIGVAVGFLFGEGTAWRKDRRKFVAMQGLTLLWVGLFALRLAVQLPLYFTGQVELLGAFKLVMGLPLFAPLLVLSWFIVRAAFPEHLRLHHAAANLDETPSA